MQVVIMQKAREDLIGIGDYIAKDNKAAAANFVIKLKKRCESIALAPQGYRARPEFGPDMRSVALQSYIIFYTLTDDKIKIMRIVHGSQDFSDMDFG
jgi:toxin ParE1/3/4